jgi:putative flippase GtrA
MKTIAQETVRYGAASACALIVDIIVLFLLVHYFSWSYVAASTASFAVGLFIVYGLSVTKVFHYRRLHDPRIEFASFAGIGVVGIAINAGVISFGVRFLGVHYLLAKCGAAAFTFVWNFLARRHFLFVPRSAA